MRKGLGTFAICTTVLALLASAPQQSDAKATIFPTGVTIFNPDKAYLGYFVEVSYKKYANHPNARYRASDLAAEEVYLRDMNGNLVNTWKIPPTTIHRARLQPNGDMIMMDSANGHFYRYSWDGKLLKEFKGIGFPRTDFRVIDDNHIIYLTATTAPKEVAEKAKNVDLEWFGPRHRKGINLVCDMLVISDWEGNIVWQWEPWHELDVNQFSPVTPPHDWTHGNSVFVLPENKWYDQGDKRFKPGNIIYNPRNLDMPIIIDRETKKIVWTWTHNELGGLSHCHEVEMIPKGLPGEGNILLFDNGLFPRNRNHVGQSILCEVNPVTKKMEWKYLTQGYSNMAFFSKTMGSQQRLPNGNTLISECNTGRLFQVKPLKNHPDGGEIVWEWIGRASFERSYMVPFDYCPQLAKLPKPKAMRVTPPHNFYVHVKPDELRSNSKDLFIVEDYQEEPEYPVTSGLTSLGFSMSLAQPDELALIEQVKLSPELCQAIFQYSRDNGGFKVPSDLLKVPGMTQEIFSKLSLAKSDYTSDVMYLGPLKGHEVYNPGGDVTKK